MEKSQLLQNIKSVMSSNESFNYYLDLYDMSFDDCKIIRIDEVRNEQYTVKDGSDVIIIRIDEHGAPINACYQLLNDTDIRAKRLMRIYS